MSRKHNPQGPAGSDRALTRSSCRPRAGFGRPTGAPTVAHGFTRCAGRTVKVDRRATRPRALRALRVGHVFAAPRLHLDRPERRRLAGALPADGPRGRKAPIMALPTHIQAAVREFHDIVNRPQTAVDGPRGTYLITRNNKFEPYQVWRSDSLATEMRTNDLERAILKAARLAGVPSE